jgi:hypothetical protein
MLELQPITFKEARAFVEEHHRHHTPPVGWKFGIAVNNGENVVGVIMVGRPVARKLDDGWTLEVNRCCTDGTRNACSKLYAAAWRVTKNLGYKRLITYTMSDESGASLRSAGWKNLYSLPGKSWHRDNRPRVDKCPLRGREIWEAR